MSNTKELKKCVHGGVCRVSSVLEAVSRVIERTLLSARWSAYRQSDSLVVHAPADGDGLGAVLLPSQCPLLLRPPLDVGRRLTHPSHVQRAFARLAHDVVPPLSEPFRRVHDAVEHLRLELGLGLVDRWLDSPSSFAMRLHAPPARVGTPHTPAAAVHTSLLH